ncbi:hypothetical protein B005_3749 [Nocardiopsis alba ATCC BAA-2165]|uniref:Uncharacterized protein n=1 Tax=Nocardiopsis alba (strain ATCC BAA-2165 / BE74) TaxID=1205910 RepID=J7LCT7_NOCAA|nr:hypothetical protein B005_3749 [Nocardiopsis alba ATCC BAA-2165]
MLRGALRAVPLWSVGGRGTIAIGVPSGHVGASALWGLWGTVPLEGTFGRLGRVRPLLLTCGRRSGRNHFVWHAYLPRIRPVEPAFAGSASGARVSSGPFADAAAAVHLFPPV